MKNLGGGDSGNGETGEENCPFVFNFEPDTFKVGDFVSYRVTGSLADFPFVGKLVGVNDDSVQISPNDPTQPDKVMKGSRESRPVVDISEV